MDTTNGVTAREDAVEGGGNGTRTRPSSGELVSRALSGLKPEQREGPLIDVGANLTDPAFKDLPGVLQRSPEAGVKALVVTGCCVQTSRAAWQLCRDHSRPRLQLYCTAGVHPHNAKGCGAATMPHLRQLLQHPQCVAVGECGLDFNRNFSPPQVQLHWFEEQVKLACELQKPLFLHCRDAGPEFIRILRRHRLTAPAIVHCWTSGNEQELLDFIDMGLYIGITGWVCDDRPERGGDAIASLLPHIPRDRLIIETDAPYLTPRSIKPSRLRPRRNEPALLPFVAMKAAVALGCTFKELARITTENSERLFGLQQQTTR